MNTPSHSLVSAMATVAVYANARRKVTNFIFVSICIWLSKEFVQWLSWFCLMSETTRPCTFGGQIFGNRSIRNLPRGNLVHCLHESYMAHDWTTRDWPLSNYLSALHLSSEKLSLITHLCSSFPNPFFALQVSRWQLWTREATNIASQEELIRKRKRKLLD